MMKKLTCLLLALVMVFSFAACRSSAPETPSNEPSESANTPDDNQGDVEPYKIAIYTGTVSQGEEEYQAAQKMAATYDNVITATYPDNFTTETETVIANLVALASDPEVKVIVCVQAIPGASAAIDKVRETRPDILVICGVPGEDPGVISSKADIILSIEEILTGDAIVQKAADMGAKTFIHYSFARHLSYSTIAARREKMIAKCQELGLEYVDVNAPDPTSDAGVSGAQQFILEDVPRQVEKYGKDTAFFATNCSMMEPLIVSISQQGAIFPQQCCPSPYHGYPAALSIDVTGHEGDVDYMLSQIKEKLTAVGQESRMSTWPIPVNMLMVQAGVEYGIEFCEGRTNGTLDEEVLLGIIKKIAGGEDKASIRNLDDEETGEVYKNYFSIMCDYVDFSK